MEVEILTVCSRMVNSYLLRTDHGCILVDTGFRGQRARIERALAEVGCRRGEITLVLITHADADHAGNAAYLRERHGTKIGMHRAEAAAAERGDMFKSRGKPSGGRRLLKPVMSLFRLGKRDRFTPDVFLEDGDRLDAYGVGAVVLHVPGHTAGSIAVLTDEGDLLSGDFLENRRRPSIATFLDDAGALRASYDRVKRLDVRVVYPGHGVPFSMDEIAESHAGRGPEREA
jgi:hydroxyacylglutathione hydrolase